MWPCVWCISNPLCIWRLYPLQVLKLWESACNIIEQREAALAQLESFEKKASDPSRFFSKGTVLYSTSNCRWRIWFYRSHGVCCSAAKWSQGQGPTSQCKICFTPSTQADSQFTQLLDRLDKRISISLQKLLKEYGDVVTYKVELGSPTSSWTHIAHTTRPPFMERLHLKSTTNSQSILLCPPFRVDLIQKKCG